MKVIGITGGVGAGKSTVLDYLNRRYHARIIQADLVAHHLMEPGMPVYYKIVEAFGSGMLKGDQTIDRQRLGELVFADQEKLEKLNKLVHPAVKEYIASEIEEERKQKRVPFVAVEAALLIEDHYETICDELWYIYADEEVREQRLLASRSYTREKSRSIMKQQLPDDIFRESCQFVIDNSSEILQNTFEQIDRGLISHGIL
ncbi:MAG TPA: dephospho-CoA kinase [Candidatus Limivivens merdigallinarum]|uniref:Dephospho-CoA kinase n=1 Tax=Candidatus Limivivens merdigallinarum TaxID=2840859 RepID=A0A9D0ZWB4_9FIRM|nr:dephospho-CoA kinase [Candidatus Limivivens merdigallinarum]